ncbi:MAG: hypothetical protein K2G36_09535 [Ruminococcus sp.]|nr:hypothetical protein [Ruminococcus sp.]
MMFKLYLSHGKIFIDLIRADCFAPVAFVEKTMTSAIFVSKKTNRLRKNDTLFRFYNL